mgnify:CR=1 FL=1
MYIDETIVLDKSLPTELLRDFEELRKFYESGDWLNFDLLFEVVEASAKSYYEVTGKDMSSTIMMKIAEAFKEAQLKPQDLDKIFRKYGIA